MIPADLEPLTRRAWLRSAALVGAAALDPAAAAAAATAAPAGGSPPGRVVFFDDPDLNLQTLFAFGAAAYAAAEFGEVMTAVQQTQRALNGVFYQAYYDAFLELGTRLDGFAGRALARGAPGHGTGSTSSRSRVSLPMSVLRPWDDGTDTGP